jgi:TRAP-type C4-dicarboxylate transport system substrate-binding protein
MSKKIKSLVFLGLALVLTFSLVAVACAPKASVGEVVPKEQLTKAQADLAAEQQKTAAAEKKTKDVEAQLASSQKPAKTISIKLESSATSGNKFDAANYFKKFVEESSDGRIKVDIILGEAIVATAEQITAIRDGVFDMILSWGPWYRDKLFLYDIIIYTQAVFDKPSDYWAMLRYHGWEELEKEQLAEWNTEYIGSLAFEPGNNMVSKIPLKSINDVKGVKMRTAGTLAMVMEALGANVVWFALSEVYTGLQSGLVDAATGDSPSGMYGLGLAEVAKYWIMPCIYRVDEMDLWANQDFWGTLTPADKQLLTNCGWSAMSQASFDNYWLCMDAVSKAQQEGVQIIYWTDADSKIYAETAMQVLPQPKDTRSTEALNSLTEYLRSVGYIE